MKYFDYKLVLLTTLEGILYAFELVPANTNGREAPMKFYQLCQKKAMFLPTKAL